jgi:hypothetical protein
VPTKLNPADDETGDNVKQFKNNSHWSMFLKLQKMYWPKENTIIKILVD